MCISCKCQYINCWQLLHPYRKHIHTQPCINMYIYIYIYIGTYVYLVSLFIHLHSSSLVSLHTCLILPSISVASICMCFLLMTLSFGLLVSSAALELPPLTCIHMQTNNRYNTNTEKLKLVQKNETETHTYTQALNAKYCLMRHIIKNSY